MSKKMKWIIGGVALLVVAMIGFKQAGFGKPKFPKVTKEKVSKRTIIETVNASGKVYPEVEVKVSSDVSGEITELTVEEGDSVRRGQVLARIYADIINTQRDAAASEVNRAQAVTSNASAGLGSFVAQIELAQKTYDRQKQLLDEKVISRAEFEQAEQSLRTLQANYAAAKEGVRANQAGVGNARAQLNRVNKDLSRTTIVAPRDGVVSLLNVKKGEKVAGNSFNVGTEILRIADMKSIEVRVDVPENDIVKVNVGDSANIEVDAYSNRKFKGVVYQIASSNTTANSLQATGNEVTNYRVFIRINPDSYTDLVKRGMKGAFPFRPGMSATADIETRKDVDVLAVPINAVTTREKGSDKNMEQVQKNKEQKEAEQEENKGSSETQVGELEAVAFVLQKDGTVKKVQVKTAVQDINYIAITSGLKEGDEVITGPYNIVSKELKNGDKVEVVEKDKLFEQ
jgi:HlyD family secretion protein